MKIKKAENLAHKASHDKLTEKEITEILQELHAYLNEEREFDRSVVETLIEIIGCLGVSSGIKAEYQQAVEQFLYFPKDSYITRTALEVIIHVWDLSTFYMNYIKVMMHGVVWEEESMVRWLPLR